MKDWARTAEDKLYIPKEVFTNPTDGTRAGGCIQASRQTSLVALVAVATFNGLLSTMHTWLRHGSWVGLEGTTMDCI